MALITAAMTRLTVEILNATAFLHAPVTVESGATCCQHTKRNIVTFDTSELLPTRVKYTSNYKDIQPINICREIFTSLNFDDYTIVWNFSIQ